MRGPVLPRVLRHVPAHELAQLPQMGLEQEDARLHTPGGTGYLSILPVDQDVEHTGGSAVAPDPRYRAFTAAVNERAGGTGPISGRKAFQRPMDQWIELLLRIQDMYRADEITVA